MASKPSELVVEVELKTEASCPMPFGGGPSIHFILVTQSPRIALPYSTGYFRVKDLAKLGTLVTLLGALIVTIGIRVASAL